MTITKQQVDDAWEQRNIYWNNYRRKLRNWQSPQAERARALYVQSLARYYSLLHDFHEQEAS